MRKFLITILSCIMLAGLSVFSLTACNEEDTTVFTVENGVITGLTDYGKTLNEIVIPESVDGVTITAIGDFAFNQNSNIVSVTIPNTVTKLGDQAFAGCSSISSLTIPNEVTSIGSFCFVHCNSLTSLTIPNSVTSIGDYSLTSLQQITLPNTDIKVGKGVFSNNLNKVNYLGTIDGWAQSKWGKIINEIELPYNGYDLYINGQLVNSINLTSLTEISPYAFYFCKSLTSVTLSGNVRSVGFAAFERCKFLISVELGENVSNIRGRAFLQCYALESINIPIGVTQIESETFTQCTSLMSINLPNSVEAIRSRAFSSCDKLNTVVMTNSVKQIGDEAFAECVELATITFDGSKEDWNSIDKGRLWHLNSKETNVSCNDGIINVNKKD